MTRADMSCRHGRSRLVQRRRRPPRRRRGPGAGHRGGRAGPGTCARTQPDRGAGPAGPVPPPHLGMQPEDLYNLRLAQRLHAGPGPGTEAAAGPAIRLASRQPGAAAAPSTGSATRAGLVVSLIPNFNRALHDSLQQARPGRALRHRADRHGRPPAAFLDRARHRGSIWSAAPRMPLQQALAAGCAGRARAPRQRHAPAPGLLPSPPAGERRRGAARAGLDRRHAHRAWCCSAAPAPARCSRIAARLPRCR